MKALAIYNMKGGVGKTTTAINLSYIAAATGQRVLVWDLDPQGAASFAFRVKPRVEGFDRKSLERSGPLRSAIKETDYNNLDLLPADFGYRKIDRFLDDLGSPDRVFTDLLRAIGLDYDLVVLDCPAGFSLLVEGIFAAADAILVPSIPTVLSLRTITRVLKWADRSGSTATVAAFFNMVDRRKTIHRQVCTLSHGYPELFLTGLVPYLSIVEQMAVRREPLGVFAARDAAAIAFAEIWSEIAIRLRQSESIQEHRGQWAEVLRAIEPLVMQLQAGGPSEAENVSRQVVVDTERRGRTCEPAAASDVCLAHGFDTEGRDLERSGYVLELNECAGSLVLLAARAGEQDQKRVARARIDNYWAVQILSGDMSPLSALQQRLGPTAPLAVERVREIVGGRKLRRIDSRVVGGVTASAQEHRERAS
jgi:cellulose biosynthesis protein BcsQ